MVDVQKGLTVREKRKCYFSERVFFCIEKSFVPIYRHINNTIIMCIDGMQD